MAHGGKRDGSGRKKGGANKINDEARKQALDSGISPLDYMLGVMRDDNNTQEVRMDAAKASAPYLHARLASIEHSGDVTMRHEDALNELDDDPRAGDPSAVEG